MRERKDVLVLFCIVACLCCAIDILSKDLVFASLDSEPWVLVPGFVQFDKKLNQGGMWSVGHSFGAATNTVLSLVSLTVAGSILGWSLLFGLRPREYGMAVLLGMILGGACGNLFDRIVYRGVRDFIELHWRDVYYYPTFNLADSFLVVGAIVIVLSSFTVRSEATTEEVVVASQAAP